MPRSKRARRHGRPAQPRHHRPRPLQARQRRARPPRPATACSWRSAERLAALARAEDTVARIGGEEFAWLLPETRRPGGLGWRVSGPGGPSPTHPSRRSGRLTMSAGVAELATGHERHRALHAADAALYWAKGHGRDACVPYAPEHEQAAGRASAAHSARLAPSVERPARPGPRAARSDGRRVDGVSGRTSWSLRHLDGDAAAFGMRPGMEIPLEETYCERMVEGRLPHLIRDARKRGARARPADHAQAGIGAYVGEPSRFRAASSTARSAASAGAQSPALGAGDVRLLRILAGMLGEELERRAARSGPDARAARGLRRVLGGEGLTVVLQPIVELAGGRVVAAEALSRFAAEPRRSPDAWFAEAAALGSRESSSSCSAIRSRPGTPRRAAGRRAPLTERLPRDPLHAGSLRGTRRRPGRAAGPRAHRARARRRLRGPGGGARHAALPRRATHDRRCGRRLLEPQTRPRPAPGRDQTRSVAHPRHRLGSVAPRPGRLPCRLRPTRSGPPSWPKASRRRPSWRPCGPSGSPTGRASSWPGPAPARCPGGWRLGTRRRLSPSRDSRGPSGGRLRDAAPQAGSRTIEVSLYLAGRRGIWLARRISPGSTLRAAPATRATPRRACCA